MGVVMSGESDKTINNTQIAARDDNRKLALIVAIQRIPRPTERDLIEATSIPKRCVHSMIKSLSKMSVIIERVNGRRHGYYTIADGGAYNLERAPAVLQDNYPDIYEQIENCALRKEEEREVETESACHVNNITPLVRTSMVAVPVAAKYLMNN
jgi:hypothetical protein